MAQKNIIKLVFILFTFLVSKQYSYGQKTEIRLNAYSGFFSFHGNGSNSTSWINFNPYTSPSLFTSNPYGKKSHFSYSFELQGQRVTNNKNIYGVGLSFERLNSKIAIDTVSENGFLYREYSADGKTYLKNSFLTLNPYLGHRYTYRKINFDILAGFDLAFCLKSNEDGNATASNKSVYTTDNEIDKPLIDFRPRIQLNTQFKKVGFLVGYSLGLTNYQIQNNPKAFTRFLRLGLSYQMK